jgi:shugoshin-like protein
MQPASPRKRAVTDKENRKSHKGLAISDEKANNRAPVHSIREDENGNIDLDHCTDPAGNKGVDSCIAEEIGSTTATESRQQIQWKKPAHSRQQDTPEPGLYTSGLVSRPTRRPRGAVSYAEPNLRDKMRRPTNEFVDAVGADRFRRVSNSQEERKNASEDYKVGAKSRTMLSKEGNFNEVPSTTPLLFADLGDTNPTGPFPSLSDLPATVNTERKRRTLSANKDELVQSQDFDINLRKAASNRRRRRESGQAYIDMHSKTSNDEESLLRPEFENDAQVEKSSVPLTTATSSTAWMSQRYLSNPENEREKLPHLEGSVQAQFQQVDDNKQLTREDSNDSVSPTEQSHFDVQDDRQRSPETNQRHSKAIPEAASTPAVEGEIKRAQRAAARRRSMLF